MPETRGDLPDSPLTDRHSLTQRVAAFIRQERLLDPGCAVFVAVSGGPDSVALLHLLSALEKTLPIARIIALHFNHQLRAEASDEDEAFVRLLSRRLGMECRVGGGDVRAFARENRLSLEMAGRACRHRFFQEALASGAADRVALAHTANDQAEEALLRLFRGTGPSGMSGMPPRSLQGIIRPLLFAWRREILAYLRTGGLDYREDVTNEEPCCRRNVLRLEMIPLIERHFHGRALDSVVRHTELVRAEESWWEAEMEARWEGLCRGHSAFRLDLDCPRLQALHPALQRRILRHAIQRLQGHLQRIHATHIEALRGLACGPPRTGHLDLPASLQADRASNLLIMSMKRPETLAFEDELPFEGTFSGPGDYRLGGWEWALRMVDPAESPLDPKGGASIKDPFVALMDAEVLVWPLHVRRRRPGDRFKPLGLHATQKLQDFFVNAKVERARRGRVPLLCDGEKICWVAGLRLDDRVKVTSRTRHVLEVRLRSRS